MMKIFGVIIGLVLLGVVVWVGWMVWGLSEEPVEVEMDKSCEEILADVRQNEPGGLEKLYDELVEQNVNPEMLFTGCDYGSDKVIEECMAKERIHRERLNCMKEFIDVGTTKQDIQDGVWL